MDIHHKSKAYCELIKAAKGAFLDTASLIEKAKKHLESIERDPINTQHYSLAYLELIEHF